MLITSHWRTQHSIYGGISSLVLDVTKDLHFDAKDKDVFQGQGHERQRKGQRYIKARTCSQGQGHKRQRQGQKQIKAARVLKDKDKDRPTSRQGHVLSDNDTNVKGKDRT